MPRTRKAKGSSKSRDQICRHPDQSYRWSDIYTAEAHGAEVFLRVDSDLCRLLRTLFPWTFARGQRVFKHEQVKEAFSAYLHTYQCQLDPRDNSFCILGSPELRSLFQTRRMPWVNLRTYLRRHSRPVLIRPVTHYHRRSRRKTIRL